MMWPELKLPPINLWNLPWWIGPGGTIHADPDRILQTDRVKEQIRFLNENWDKIKSDR